MAEPRLRHRSFTWAPRTLAVISCALALLALQPTAGAALPSALKSRPVVLRDGAGDVAADVATHRVAPREAGRTVAARRDDASFLSTARRLHILATVEILQRLLICELRPAERAMLPAMWFEAVCVGVIEPPTMPATGRVEAGMPVVPVVERDFAIGHCLLAPPIS